MSASRPRALHVAALPFPTPQGTQAAIARMLEASARAGDRPMLVTYADGIGDAPAGVDHVRVPGAQSGALRSGPSVGKLGADLALAAALAPLRRQADVVVAHHVEAALAAMLAGVRPVLFVAHTALGPELPTYFARGLRAPLASAGASLDRLLASRADAVAAVSPLLARDLARSSGRVVHALPIPWPVPERATRKERESARRALGIEPDAAVVLYAGNLDAYQGLEVLGRALEQLAARCPRLVFLLATESPSHEMLPHLDALARRSVVRARLATEADRRRVHAAASVAVVPRRSPGGLPVKLLDAMARGVPTVACRRALAGYALEAAVVLAEDDDPDALDHALERALELTAGERAALVSNAREHVAEACSDRAFVAALDQALADALGRA